MYRAYYDNKNIYVLQYQNNKVISYVSFTREEEYTKDIKETLKKYAFTQLSDSYMKWRMPSSLAYMFREGTDDSYDWINFKYETSVETAQNLSSYIDWKTLHEKLSKLLNISENLVPSRDCPPYEISDFEKILEQLSICICLNDELVSSCFDMAERLIGIQYHLNGMLR